MVVHFDSLNDCGPLLDPLVSHLVWLMLGAYRLNYLRCLGHRNKIHMEYATEFSS